MHTVTISGAQSRVFLQFITPKIRSAKTIGLTFNSDYLFAYS